MMKRTLYKAISKSISTPIITFSFSIIGIYVGYLIWYVLSHYMPGSISDYRVLVAILVIWICTFVAIYKIPDQLFTNRRIKDVLCFPMSASQLVLLVAGRLVCLQFGITVSAFWAYFLYVNTDLPLILAIMLLCWIGSCLIDLLILIMSVTISNMFPASSVGYGFILFQYGTFLLLALSAGNFVSKIFFWPGFLEKLNMIFHPVRWLMIAILITILLTVCACFCVKTGYIRGYLNSQDFQYRRTDKIITPTKIRNPYFLLEWKRVTRNKEIIFFSNIKNILTVFVLYELLIQNFEWIGSSEKYAMEMFNAGSNLKSKSDEEIFYQDFKKFISGKHTYGVGQITSMNKEELANVRERIEHYMEGVLESRGLEMVYFMLTDILGESTELLCEGHGAQEIVENAFGVSGSSGCVHLKGVVSRKKQLIPRLMNEMQG